MTLSTVEESKEATSAEQLVPFLLELFVLRAAKHSFWSRIELVVDDESVEHWVRRAQSFRGEPAHRWVWKDLTPDLNLDVLAKGQSLYRRCAEFGCVHPAHLTLAVPAKPQSIEPALPLVFEHRADHAFWSQVVLLVDDTGARHWIWSGPGLSTAHRRVWNELMYERGQPGLKRYEHLYRTCEWQRCVNPDHMTTSPEERSKLVSRAKRAWRQPRGLARGTEPEAAKTTVRDAEETSRRYREDPAFKAAVRAELRAKAQARREDGRARIAKRNAKKNEMKETIRG